MANYFAITPYFVIMNYNYNAEGRIDAPVNFIGVIIFTTPRVTFHSSGK